VNRSSGANESSIATNEAPNLRQQATVGGNGVIEVEGYGECVPIGRGGVGEVYRSTRLSTGADVAIKVLYHVSDESAAWRRTRRELAAMVALSGHAHVIGVIEVHDLPGGPALVMEYAPGGSVGDLLAARPAPNRIGESVLIAEHAAKALVAAHARGIVHRDIKPHNLLIDGYGQVKLCDFGIASLARSDEFRTQTHAVSPRYASPEDLEGDFEAGPATDIYSLGATLLHLVHGAPPSLRERLAGWESPSTSEPDALDALDDVNAVIAACLEVDPSARPNAAEVLQLLEQLPLNSVDRCGAIITATPSAVTADSPRAPADVASVHVLPYATDRTDFVDVTVVRPSLGSPAPPLEVASKATHTSNIYCWRRRALVALGVVAVVGAGSLLWQVVTGNNGDAANSAAAMGVSERPADLVELTLLDWPGGVVGECLVQPSEGTILVVVECSSPHDLQRVAMGRLEFGNQLDLATIDDATVTSEVGQRCAEAWEVLKVNGSIMLPAAVNDVLQLSNVRPTAEAAAAGETAYQCFVGVPGKRLTGSIAGARK